MFIHDNEQKTGSVARNIPGLIVLTGCLWAFFSSHSALRLLHLRSTLFAEEGRILVSLIKWSVSTKTQI